MKKKILMAILALFLVSAFSYSDTFSLKVNYFVPRGLSSSTSPDSLWKIEHDNMDYGKSDFQGVSFGLSYEYFLTRVFSLEFSIDAFYSKTANGSYRDYLGFEYDSDFWAVPADLDNYMDVDTFSTDHSLTVSIMPIQISLKIAPFGRQGRFIPYFGGGIGVYFWTVRMEGDLIDFSDEYEYQTIDDYFLPVYPIYFVDAEEKNKLAFGFHVLGGFMLSLSKTLTLDIGAKYNVAKGKMSDAFLGFDPFDLGGLQLSLGLNYRFR